MEDDLDATRARLDRLAYLTYRALSTQPEDRARMERTIQLVCRSLQTAAWAHERIGTAKHQREAAEVAALHRWIIEQAQSAGLRITDDDASR